MISAFLDALGADGPSADRAGKMDLYGRFVGSWDLDVRQFSEDGRECRRAGEWHFGWALEGRAIQDVWIVPPRGELRHGDAAARFNSYGTTLRVYDPDIDGWRIQWTDPVTRSFLQMIGRADGDDIVQSGTRPDGQLLRWSFREITPDAFLWRTARTVGAPLAFRFALPSPERRGHCPAARMGEAVDIVVDGGLSVAVPMTLLDLTSVRPRVASTSGAFEAQRLQRLVPGLSV